MSAEAGYIAVLLAALGLPELGAAISVSITAPLTRVCGLVRQKYAKDVVSGARCSDVLVDTKYFLEEREMRYKKAGNTGVTSNPLVKIAFELFERLKTPLGLKSKDNKVIQVAKRHLDAYFDIALAVICSAYAFNAYSFDKNLNGVPLHFTSNRPLKTVAIDNNTSAFYKKNASLVAPTAACVLVPANFAYIQHLKADCIPSENTLVPQRFFFASVACLLPALSSHGATTVTTLNMSFSNESYIHVDPLGKIMLARSKVNLALELFWRGDADSASNAADTIASIRSLLVGKEPMNQARQPYSRSAAIHDASFCYSPNTHPMSDVKKFIECIVDGVESDPLHNLEPEPVED
eukprot:GILI01026328.1.p1 GENE.GILI01026328.1~~GILI01026328.1.p1  ORF type:complete len:406 (-),score=42.23 GILI01026328.1:81-1130(-)